MTGKDLVRSAVKTAVGAAVAWAAARGLEIDAATVGAFVVFGTGVAVALLNKAVEFVSSKVPALEPILRILWPRPTYSPSQ